MPIIKITIIILVAVICFSFAPPTQAQQNSTATFNSNRFLLFSGAFAVTGSSQTLQGVFKLDTFTGRAWFLQVAVINKQLLMRWVLIKDSKGQLKGGKIIPSGDIRNQ